MALITKSIKLVKNGVVAGYCVLDEAAITFGETKAGAKIGSFADKTTDEAKASGRTVGRAAAGYVIEFTDEWVIEPIFGDPETTEPKPTGYGNLGKS